jgi:ATP-binding cassette, subfamily F, member 3
MTLQLSRASKSFGADEIFENINFEIKPNDKIAIIGRNGCGKTTLLKILAQELELNSGDIFKPRDLTVGYLAQASFKDETLIVEDYFLSLFESLFSLEARIASLAEELKHNTDESILEQFSKLSNEYERLGGYTYKQEMMTIFTQFGFSESDLKRRIGEFSGGQKTRLAFVYLLLSKPDILLLDEPTNHLDMSTIEWLETYLNHYEKALVFVSHDRMFIDHVAKVIVEMEYGELTSYHGNYASYQTQKALNQEKQLSSFKRQQKDIERLELLIEKFRYKKNKAKFAQSKIKYLDKLEKIEAPKENKRNFKARFFAKNRGGKQVLTVKDLEIGYHERLALINLDLIHGQHCAVVGPNGHGKSTFLKTILGKVPLLSGEYLFGHQIDIGYFDQEQIEYKSNQTIIEDLWDAYPDMTHTEIRTVLGSFLFTSDEVFKEVNVLSGGEKVRLALAKLMLKGANLLILDEPTNHLDIPGKEALEKSLSEYEGTILFVSHDRYFVNKMAKGILSIENGRADYYQVGNPIVEKVENVQVNENEQKVHARMIKSTSRINKQIQKIEESIALKEEELAIAREKRFDPFYYHNHLNMQELDNSIDDLHNQINALMKEWESLHEQLNKSSQGELDTL